MTACTQLTAFFQMSLLMLLVGCHAWTASPLIGGAGTASDAAPLLGEWALVEVADEAPATPIPISVAFAEPHWLSVAVELGGQSQTRQVAFSAFADSFLISVDNTAGGYFLAKLLVGAGGDELEVQAFDMDELETAITSGALSGVIKPQEYEDILVQITTEPSALAAYLQGHPELFLGPAARLVRLGS